MFSIDDVIEMAVQIEQNGEALLRKAQGNSSDAELNALFRWLADEEAEHVRCFRNLRPPQPEASDTAQVEALGKTLLLDILGAETFSLKDSDLNDIREVHDLLNKMIEFENDTVLFYEMIRSVVSDRETRKAIDHIIAQEKLHAEALERFLASHPSATMR